MCVVHEYNRSIATEMPLVAKWNHEIENPASWRKTMISHCANPDCGKPFHYLHGGRLYRFDVAPPNLTSEDIPNAICSIGGTHMAVFFWLCEQCSSTQSLNFDGRGVSVTHSPVARRRRRENAPVVAVGELKTNGITGCGSEPLPKPESLDPNGSQLIRR